MYKKKISYLLHTLTSFILMLISSRLLNIFAGELFDPYLNKLLIFILSSAVGIAAFYVMPQDITPVGTDEIADPVQPLEKSDIANSTTMTIIAVCSMIGLMHIVAAFLGGDGNGASYPLTPLYFVSLVIIHPLIEEFIFRKLYHGELRLLTPVFAAVAQATLFALNHDSASSMFNALFCGIVLGLLVEGSGRWYLAAAAHSFINLRTLIYSTVLAGNTSLANNIDLVFYAVGTVALIIIVVLRVRDREEKEVEEEI